MSNNSLKSKVIPVSKHNNYSSSRRSPKNNSNYHSSRDRNSRNQPLKRSRDNDDDQLQDTDYDKRRKLDTNTKTVSENPSRDKKFFARLIMGTLKTANQTSDQDAENKRKEVDEKVKANIEAEKNKRKEEQKRIDSEIREKERERKLKLQKLQEDNYLRSLRNKMKENFNYRKNFFITTGKIKVHWIPLKHNDKTTALLELRLKEEFIDPFPHVSEFEERDDSLSSKAKSLPVSHSGNNDEDENSKVDTNDDDDHPTSKCDEDDTTTTNQNNTPNDANIGGDDDMKDDKKNDDSKSGNDDEKNDTNDDQNSK